MNELGCGRKWTCTGFVSLLISRDNLLSSLHLEGQTNLSTKLSICIIPTDTGFPKLLWSLLDWCQLNQTYPLTHPDLLSSPNSVCDWQLLQNLLDTPTGQTEALFTAQNVASESCLFPCQDQWGWPWRSRAVCPQLTVQPQGHLRDFRDV